MLMLRRGGAGSNPFAIFDQSATSNGGGGILPCNFDVTGKTASTNGTGLSAGEKTLIQLIIGDSFECNSCAGPYTPSNPTHVDMLKLDDGSMWQYKDFWLSVSNGGAGTGSYHGATSDSLINSGKVQRVINIGCATGGATSFDYSKRGAFSHKVIAALLYCRRYGYPLSGTVGLASMACTINFGINDQVQGYTGAVWTTNVQSIIDLLRDYGFQGKIFLAKKTRLGASVSTGIQNARDAMLNSSLGIYAGADWDALSATASNTDGTHPTVSGVTNYSAAWAAVFSANY